MGNLGIGREALRWTFVGMRLLVITAAFAVGDFFFNPDLAFYGVIAVFYAAAISHILLMGWKAKRAFFSQVQLVVDIVLATGLVHYTGGIDSVFALLYPLCILAAAVTGSGQIFTQSIAVGSSLLFGMLVLLETTGVLVPMAGPYSGYEQGSWWVAFLYFFKIFIFGLVSVVASVLVRRLDSEQVRSHGLEDFSARVLGRMTYGAITADAGDKIIYANKHALQILGREFAQIVGRDWRTFFQSGSLDETIMNPAATFSEPHRNEVRLKIHDKEGREKIVGLNSFDQYGPEGQLRSKVVLFRDLTQTLRMEKKLKASEKWALLGELSAGIAHEIRNPLSSIHGSVEVLKERRNLSGRDASLLDVILQESDRLNGILEDYLTYAQKKTSERKDCDLGHVLEEVLRVVKGHPKMRRDVRLDWQRGNGQEWVCINDQQIRQVLLNILQNALEAMPKGGDLKVRLAMAGAYDRAKETAKIEFLNRWVRLDIQDSGMGISQDVMDRLYEPFFSTKEGGHGIGLALCRRIVEGHKGFFKVQSEPGKGTTFSMYLPLAPEAARARTRDKARDGTHG